jgi:hypothetical protein
MMTIKLTESQAVIVLAAIRYAMGDDCGSAKHRGDRRRLQRVADKLHRLIGSESSDREQR